MVNNAIMGSGNAEDRLFRPSRSSSPQITKSTPKVAPFIKKYLKGAVASGSLVQTKGKGASVRSTRLVHSGGARSRLRLRQEETRFVRRIQDENHPPNVPPSRRLPTRLLEDSQKTNSQSEEDCCRKKSAAAASAAAAKAKKSAASSAERN
ncbi:unnamed protein product [Tenebrio molitor]|nr:unnamed protein product [Tenebrio molitor]